MKKYVCKVPRFHSMPVFNQKTGETRMAGMMVAQGTIVEFPDHIRANPETLEPYIEPAPVVVAKAEKEPPRR